MKISLNYLFIKKGERSILSEARNEREAQNECEEQNECEAQDECEAQNELNAQDEGRRKIKRLLPVHFSGS